MREIKTTKYKGSILLRFAIFAFAAVFVFSLINQQIEISKKLDSLEVIQKEIKIQEIKNDDIRYSLENENDMEEYIEKIARKEYDYVKPGERVFVNVSPNS